MTLKMYRIIGFILRYENKHIEKFPRINKITFVVSKYLYRDYEYDVLVQKK